MVISPPWLLGRFCLIDVVSLDLFGFLPIQFATRVWIPSLIPTSRQKGLNEHKTAAQGHTL